MASLVSTKLVRKDEWDNLTPLFSDLSYRQCASYAEAAARDIGAASEFVAFFHAEQLIGLANLRVKSVPFAPIGIAYSNYGPLTARGTALSVEHFGRCLDALVTNYVKHRGLILRIVPPLCGGQWLEAQASCLRAHGFQHFGGQTHETLILDLAKPLSDIRKNFDGKWRNCLSKAERSCIEVTRTVAPADFDRFEPMFVNLSEKKGFATTQDVSFFRRVQQEASSSERLVAHLAWHDGELVAGHIGSFVGDTAVYLLGASSSDGRKLCAAYLLQWSVIEYAKSAGKLYYDLGGIDPRNNPNVYAFKKGLNGRHVIEIGGYEVAPNRPSRIAVHFLEAVYNRIRNKGRST
jgi:hypothetical protein